MSTGWRVIFTEALAFKAMYAKRFWKLSRDLPPQEIEFQVSEVGRQMTDNRRQKEENRCQKHLNVEDIMRNAEDERQNRKETLKMAGRLTRKNTDITKNLLIC